MLVTTSLLGGMGCATSYVPQEPGRIAVMSSGGLVLVKDGKTFSGNGFSSESVEAVSGNPRAEEEARTYVRRMRTAGVLSLVGLGTLLGSFALYTGEPGHGNRNTAAIALEFGVVPIVLISAWTALATAPRHLYNAVNIYNDGVWQTRPGEIRGSTVERTP